MASILRAFASISSNASPAFDVPLIPYALSPDVEQGLWLRPWF
jgi:hypothetical protein